MYKATIRQIAIETICSIREIDFSKLDISEYNKDYISMLLPHIHYHFKIYSDAIYQLLDNEIHPGYIVDFGGGHGFLSLFLKRLGLDVIYCDHNPQSVKTITCIKKEIGFGPDLIIEGSSTELLSFCKTNNLIPNWLIATDLIEHVYDLYGLFFDFQALNPNLSMIFTTGSVKSNLLKSGKLRKMMIEEERSVYFPLRKQFLEENYPDKASSEIIKLAVITRGLKFTDIKYHVDKYLDTKIFPFIDIDKYNTCDPRDGNWAERILSKKQYRKIINTYHFQVSFKNGFYNEERHHPITFLIAKIANFFVRYLSFSIFAPFILLIVKKKC